MIKTNETVFETLAITSSATLEYILTSISQIQVIPEEVFKKHPEFIEIIDRILVRLTYFKHYYFMLSCAFLETKIPEMNKLVSQYIEIPENERNRIDFNLFNAENFNAINQFFNSYVRIKLNKYLEVFLGQTKSNMTELNKNLFFIVH